MASHNPPRHISPPLLTTWIAAVLAISLLTPVVAADEPADEPVDGNAASAQAPSLFPWTGEELFYSVQINDTEAMRGGLRTGEIRSRGGQRYISISASARSRGFLDAAYPIDDNAITYLNADTTFPLRTEKTFDENGQFRSYDVDYDHASFTADVERHRQDREATFQSPIPEQTHDMLTWIYELRQVEDLSLGDEFSFYIYDGWLLTRLDLEVVEREDLLTPMGWFKTWRFAFTRRIKDAEENNSGDEPAPPELSIAEEARHTGSLWLSRDANKIPVQVTIDTPFGAGEAVLIHYTPGEPG